MYVIYVRTYRTYDVCMYECMYCTMYVYDSMVGRPSRAENDSEGLQYRHTSRCGEMQLVTCNRRQPLVLNLGWV